MRKRNSTCLSSSPIHTFTEPAEVDKPSNLSYKHTYIHMIQYYYINAYIHIHSFIHTFNIRRKVHTYMHTYMERWRYLLMSLVSGGHMRKALYVSSSSSNLRWRISRLTIITKQDCTTTLSLYLLYIHTYIHTYIYMCTHICTQI